MFGGLRLLFVSASVVSIMSSNSPIYQLLEIWFLFIRFVNTHSLASRYLKLAFEVICSLLILFMCSFSLCKERRIFVPKWCVFSLNQKRDSVIVL